MTCTDPNYHSHGCEGASLERIADALERLADKFAPTPEMIEDKYAKESAAAIRAFEAREAREARRSR